MSPVASGLQIRDSDLQILSALLGEYLPDAEIWAYGSRVHGKARPSSDLDLVIFGQQGSVSNLKEALDESNISIPVDLHVWEELPESFHDQIRRRYWIVQPGVNLLSHD
jgi:uncharacterized protein